MIDYCLECGSDQWDGKHCCPACGFLHRNEEADDSFLVATKDAKKYPNSAW